MQKGEKGVQIACTNAYVSNGRPPIGVSKRIDINIEVELTNYVCVWYKGMVIGIMYIRLNDKVTVLAYA